MRENHRIRRGLRFNERAHAIGRVRSYPLRPACLPPAGIDPPPIDPGRMTIASMLKRILNSCTLRDTT